MTNKEKIMEEKNNTLRGYKLTLTNLENGEEILNEEIDCFTGGYHRLGCKATDVGYCRVNSGKPEAFIIAAMKTKGEISKAMSEFGEEELSATLKALLSAIVEGLEDEEDEDD